MNDFDFGNWWKLRPTNWREILRKRYGLFLSTDNDEIEEKIGYIVAVLNALLARSWKANDTTSVANHEGGSWITDIDTIICALKCDEPLPNQEIDITPNVILSETGGKTENQNAIQLLSSGLFVWNFQDEITSIENHLTVIDSEITDIYSKITTINNEITTINQHLTTIDNEITAINIHLGNIDTEITNLTTDVSKLKQQMSGFPSGSQVLARTLIAQGLAVHNNQNYALGVDISNYVAIEIQYAMGGAQLSAQIPYNILDNSNPATPELSATGRVIYGGATNPAFGSIYVKMTTAGTTTLNVGTEDVVVFNPTSTHVSNGSLIQIQAIYGLTNVTL